MSWKGRLRSIDASVKAAEKNAAKRHEQAVKDQIAAAARAEVENWKRYVDDLVTVHTDMADAIDWHAMKKAPAPVAPEKNSACTDAAQEALNAFNPGYFKRLSGGAKKQRIKLEQALEDAPLQDEEAFAAAQAEHEIDLLEWQEECDLAKRLIAGEAKAINEVLKESGSVFDQTLVGTNISFSISDDHIHAKPLIHADDIIPKTRRKQLANGKLSETKMPIGEFQELYQDYVASVAIKIAGDLFHILPGKEVYVTCMVLLLNSSTGHEEETPILSVKFTRDRFFQLNLSKIDPSDSLANFNHSMSFSKTAGFKPIVPLPEKERGLRGKK